MVIFFEDRLWDQLLTVSSGLGKPQTQPLETSCPYIWFLAPTLMKSMSGQTCMFLWSYAHCSDQCIISNLTDKGRPSSVPACLRGVLQFSFAEISHLCCREHFDGVSNDVPCLHMQRCVISAHTITTLPSKCCSLQLESTFQSLSCVCWLTGTQPPQNRSTGNTNIP